MTKQKPRRKTVKRAKLSNIAMVGRNERSITKVILDGVVIEWVGFGWINLGPPGADQIRNLPHVVD